MTLDPRKMTKEERRCASTYEDQLRIAEEIYSDPTLNIKSSSMGTRFEGLSEILIKNYTSDTIRALTKYGIFIIDKLAYFADEANKENLKIRNEIHDERVRVKEILEGRVIEED
jgi:hypothetical protein